MVIGRDGHMNIKFSIRHGVFVEKIEIECLCVANNHSLSVPLRQVQLLTLGLVSEQKRAVLYRLVHCVDILARDPCRLPACFYVSRSEPTPIGQDALTPEC